MRKPSAFLAWAAVLAALLIVGTAGCAHMPEEKEPAGFRGLSWGSRIDEVSGLKPVGGDGERRDYRRAGDKMKIGDAPLKRITYRFYKERLYSVVVDYQGEENYHLIWKTLMEAYGDGRLDNRFFKKWHWTGEKVEIVFSYSNVTNDGTLIYQYLPITSEMSGVNDL